MSTIDLKEYTARAVELEAAIYTQKSLMSKHKQIRKEQAPALPAKRHVHKPLKPEQPTYIQQPSNAVWWGYAIFMIIMAVGLIILGLWLFSLNGVALAGLVCIGVGGWMIYLVAKINNKREENDYRNQQTAAIYNKNCDAYKLLMLQYTNDIVSADREYHSAYKQYQADIAAYDAQSNSIMAQHSGVLVALEEALQTLYDENVIYPKYRNMVAMTTINEYLMSGRCSELEGANGAYNLYEMELRQNIVINQLSSIVNNLEQIRNSQFLLYQELLKANDTVEQICCELRGIGKTSKLTAYFSAVTAKAAVSPKIIRGIIH